MSDDEGSYSEKGGVDYNHRGLGIGIDGIK